MSEESISMLSHGPGLAENIYLRDHMHMCFPMAMCNDRLYHAYNMGSLHQSDPYV